MMKFIDLVRFSAWNGAAIDLSLFDSRHFFRHKSPFRCSFHQWLLGYFRMMFRGHTLKLTFYRKVFNFSSLFYTFSIFPVSV